MFYGKAEPWAKDQQNWSSVTGCQACEVRVAVLVTEAFKRPIDLVSSGDDGQRLASQVALVVKNLPAKAGDKKCGFDVWFKSIPWRRKWHPTPVFLLGESHG